MDLSGEIRASTGILFGTDTAAANTLDDYEEGTYTATITCGTSGTITLGNKVASYTKIGRVVHAQGYLDVASVSSPVGEVNFLLPVTTADLTDISGINSGGSVLTYGVNYGACDYIGVYMSENSNYFVLNEITTNAAWVGMGGEDFSANDVVVFSVTYFTT